MSDTENSASVKGIVYRRLIPGRKWYKQHSDGWRVEPDGFFDKKHCASLDIADLCDNPDDGPIGAKRTQGKDDRNCVIFLHAEDASRINDVVKVDSKGRPAKDTKPSVESTRAMVPASSKPCSRKRAAWRGSRVSGRVSSVGSSRGGAGVSIAGACGGPRGRREFLAQPSGL